MESLPLRFRMCGDGPDGLISIPDRLVNYVRSIMSNEAPSPPEMSAEHWSALLQALRPHWIIPFLYWRIGSLSRQLRPPESVIGQMREAFLTSRLRCQLMERQLDRILGAFRNQGVKALVLRGPAWALSLYPDPALRPSSDLDLLVHPEQVGTAREILERMNYRCLSRRFEVASDFFREEDFVHLKNPTTHVPVDLHWTQWELQPFLSSGRGTGVEELFWRAVKVGPPSREFETLHPIDALIHSAVHLSLVHGQEMRLIWLLDIARLFRQLEGPGDWAELAKRSAAGRALRAVEYSLKMAEHWAGLELPEKMASLSRWARPTPDELALWSETAKHHWTSLLLRRYLKRSASLSAMARSLRHLLFPPAEIVRHDYPPSRDWLLPLSYVRRLSRWFRELVINRVLAILRG